MHVFEGEKSKIESILSFLNIITATLTRVNKKIRIDYARGWNCLFVAMSLTILILKGVLGELATQTN